MRWSLTDRLESERDRWILWLPVALAIGDGLYFGLASEPPLSVGIAALAVTLLALLAGRSRPFWPILLGLTLIALGFFAAEWRCRTVAAKMLEAPIRMMTLWGRVVEVEPVENGQRLLLDQLSGTGIEGVQRVRVRLRNFDPVAPGQRLRLRASLMPPPPPLVPGGYDFTRQAWFQRIGAVGYEIGHPVVLPPRPDPDPRERAALLLGRFRQFLSARINGAILAGGFPPGIATVAASLVTGQRGPVPMPVLADYRDAGLAHILVIAGMHLSMVAGLVLVGLRLLLAAIPALALYFPIHKWTACGALLVTFCYLLISGAPVPTQRAFIMSGCALLAILLDRQPLSLRAISLAASILLLTQPESLCSASFQLSFAAVYGLIAGYEALGPRLAAWRQHGHSFWRMPLLYIAGILLTTQIAASATAFYSLFHFNRYAVYSLLGNALAVPLVGFWVMPAALIAMLLLPFGLDGLAWQAMAAGLARVTDIARWVAHLPGATLSAPAMPPVSLLLFSLGAAWLILWRRRWRLYGLAPMAAAILLALIAPPPDLLVDGSFKFFALREADGHLRQFPGHAGQSLRQAWAHEAGEGDRLADISGDSRLNCALDGCWLQSGGRERWIPLDRRHWQAEGTHAIWLTEPPRVLSVAAWQGRRPWRPSAGLGNEEELD